VLDLTLRQTSHRAGKSYIAVCMTALLALCPFTLSAQPELPVTQLLFEPVLIPAEGEVGNAAMLTSLANMPDLVSSDELEDEGMDAATRLQRLATIQEYVTAIGDKESEEGPYSEELIQDLHNVGELQQELNDHEQALEFFERARNLSRINEGIDTLIQAPMIEGQIESLSVLGRLKEADELQESLLTLNEDFYGADSEELVPAIHKLGDWNLQAFLQRSNIALNIGRVNASDFITQNNYNAVDQTANNLFSAEMDGDPTNTPLYKLYLAQTNFLGAINILIQNKNYTHPEILELERKLITTAFLRTHQENIVYEPDFYLNRKSSSTGSRLDTSAQNLMYSPDYDSGLTSLKRSLSYISVNDQRTSLQVAQAMIEEADWHMLFERKRLGREKYEEAYAFFQQYPDMEAQIVDYIYSDIPVTLPVFLPPPNSREKLGIGEDEEVKYFGYFDVTFTVNRNGQARRVKIQDQAGEVTRNMEIRLTQYLQNVMFRPRFDREGKLDNKAYNLRYYVGI
jgi:tetratricopeptide (TPR) repeat protein